MTKTVIPSNVQLSLFQEGTGVKDHSNGNANIARLSNYLKTREGLWRLLALFPADMPVVEAVRLAPSMLCPAKKGGRV